MAWARAPQHRLFLDGHVNMVKQAPPQTEPMTEAGFSRLAKEKRSYY